MKRLPALCIFVILSVFLLSLFQTALDPAAFSGQWYTSGDQCVYWFQEGLIFTTKQDELSYDLSSACGAYTYCKNSIVLFVVGVEGLETEKELYLIRKENTSILCEDKAGYGPVYFIRYQK